MPAFTRKQTKEFFKTTIGCRDDEVIEALEREGIEEVEDLVDFVELDTIKLVLENMRRPVGTMEDPDDSSSQIPIPKTTLGAKAVMRLQASAKLVSYYEEVGRGATPGNTTWKYIKAFKLEDDALKDRAKNDDEPDVPKITKALPILKWTVAFADFLHRVMGVRKIPLAYIIRPMVDPGKIGPQEANKPYSSGYQSVEEEWIARALHDHALYRDDNAKLYHLLEEAMRGTVYAASISPYQRKKDGLKAWTAVTSQFSGEDKWEKLLKEQEEIIHKRKWLGTGSFRLEQFVAQHRNAYILLTQCAERVDYQLPNEFTRVTKLLDAIETSDSQLQANIALVRSDKTGKMRNFEDTVSFILPACPVARRRTGDRKHRTNVSEVEGTDDTPEDVGKISSVEKYVKKGGRSKYKAARGKTGVELRFHKGSEYKALSKEQRDELTAWRNEKKKKAQPEGDKKRKAQPETTKAEASSVVTKPSKLRSIAQKIKQ